MKKDFNEVILRPIISEKATLLRDNQNVYVFEVYKDATKHDIKNLIEEVYNVKVEKVNIVNVKGKVKQRRLRRQSVTGRTKDKKKAYVKLKSGDTIEILKGV